MPTSAERFAVIGWFNSVLSSPAEAERQWAPQRPELMVGRVAPTARAAAAAAPPARAAPVAVGAPGAAMAAGGLSEPEAAAKAAWLARRGRGSWVTGRPRAIYSSERRSR